MNMKRLLAAVLFLCLLLNCIPPVQTNAAYTDGNYTFERVDDGVIITDYRTTTDVDITIPATLWGHPVIGIGDNAFDNCGMNSVKIPDGVTTIRRDAFINCDGLTSITLPDSVTTIDSLAFSCCFALTDVRLPASVQSIAKDAFFCCPRLTLHVSPDSAGELYCLLYGWRFTRVSE